MFKFVPFFAILAVARAGVLHAAAPFGVAQPVLAKQVDEYDPHPQYNFAYEVQDALSGDSKNQVESRDGDVVHGQYSLIDADGHRRVVDYTADPVNGFNAVVRREPLAVKAIAAAPAVVKAAPVATYAAAPALIKSAPLATTFAAAAPFASALAAPSFIKSAPLAAYASAPAAYSFAAPSLIKAAPIASYAAPLASGAIVKTAYSSPIASYHY